jgi:hypothetical protein
MSDAGKSAAARAKSAPASDRAETAAATSSTEAATSASCVEAATSAVPAEPSAARLGTTYRNGKRKEGKRGDRSNAQIFWHRNLSAL